MSITSPGCCDAGVEQVVFISDAAQFPQANMKVYVAIGPSDPGGSDCGS